MRTKIKSNWCPIASGKLQSHHAFTLLELVVVLSVLVALAGTLLPALARSKAETKVTACAANYRQWAVVVNMYAKDNRDWLPRFDLPGTAGNYIWDVGPAMGTNLYPYGLPVPTWFCPVRAIEFQIANSLTLSRLGHPLTSPGDLWYYMNYNYRNELVTCNNWWIPRAGHSDGNVNNPNSADATWPPDYNSPSNPHPGNPNPLFVRGSDPWFYGWPKRLDDRGSAHVAFMSDACGSGIGGGLSSLTASPNVKDIAPNTAHFFNGVLDGVNAAYVDGHVEARSPAKMRCVYQPYSGSTFWFY